MNMTEATPLGEIDTPFQREIVVQRGIGDLQMSFLGYVGPFGSARPAPPHPAFPSEPEPYVVQFASAVQVPFRVMGQLLMLDFHETACYWMRWLQGDQPQKPSRRAFLPSLRWWRNKLVGPPNPYKDKHREEAELLISALRQVVQEQRLVDDRSYAYAVPKPPPST